MAISAATWVPIDHIGLDQAIDATSTTQKYTAGKRIRCRDVGSTARGEAVFQYAKGVASVVAGDACVISANNDAAIRTVARSIGPIGIAMAAIVASNWGWFQVSGVGIVTAGTVADDTTPYLTATAGSLDDAVVAGDIVYGARFAGATDTGQALIELSYPHANDTDGA